MNGNHSRRRMIDWIIIGLTAAATIASGAMVARASETISYSYDTRGRLKQVSHSGSVNNGVTTTYTHDKADNRTNKTTSGAP
jgi:hypothetical protein